MYLIELQSTHARTLARSLAQTHARGTVTMHARFYFHKPVKTCLAANAKVHDAN